MKMELQEIIRAVTIHSPTSFSFAGSMFPPLPDGIPFWPITPATNALVAQLAFQFYQHCFCRTFNGTITEAHVPVPAADDNLVAELTAANGSRAGWDAGWQALRMLPSGQIIARKNERTRMLWPGEFVSHEGPGIPPREGARLSLFTPRESTTMQPGFYFVFGEFLPDQQDDYNLVRFYWHLTASGAAPVVRSITRELNRFQIPFRFKTLVNRSAYHRFDAAVLYINKRFYRLTAELLSSVYPGLKQFLGAGTPLFAKPLAPGLGFAEDPGQTESFGQHRCRLFAEGLWNAYEKGRQAELDRWEEVASHFAGQGLLLERAYLNPGSQDEYDFPGPQA
jgi:hypothetical protein